MSGRDFEALGKDQEALELNEAHIPIVGSRVAWQQGWVVYRGLSSSVVGVMTLEPDSPSKRTGCKLNLRNLSEALTCHLGGSRLPITTAFSTINLL